MKLEEQIAYAVAQVLLEVETGFSWSDFKKIENHKKRHEYLGRHLKFLGVGSARAAYQLDPKHVIKIANIRAFDEVSPKGTAQNEMEVDVFTNPKTKPVVTNIYDMDSDYIWIVSEYAEPLDDLKAEIGFDHVVFGRAIELLQRESGNKEKTKEYIDKVVARWKKKIEKGQGDAEDLEITHLGIEEFEAAKSALDHSIVDHVYNLAKDNRIDWGDLIRAEHWGRTSEGRLVVVDYGFSQEIADAHYGPWS